MTAFMKFLFKIIIYLITIYFILMTLYGIFASRFLEPIFFEEERLDPRLGDDIEFDSHNDSNLQNIKIPVVMETSEQEFLKNTNETPYSKLTFLHPLPKRIKGNLIYIDRIYIYWDNGDRNNGRKNKKISKTITLFIAKNRVVDYTIIIKDYTNIKHSKVLYTNKSILKKIKDPRWFESNIDISCYKAQLPLHTRGGKNDNVKDCPYDYFFIEKGIDLNSLGRKFYRGLRFIVIFSIFWLFW
jgi:hypothetical protein